MAETTPCPTCGYAVRVVGETTDEQISDLVWKHVGRVVAGYRTDEWHKDLIDDLQLISFEFTAQTQGLASEIERLQAERDTILNAMRTRPDRIDEFLAWYDEQKQEAVNG